MHRGSFPTKTIYSSLRQQGFFIRDANGRHEYTRVYSSACRKMQKSRALPYGCGVGGASYPLKLLPPRRQRIEKYGSIYFLAAHLFHLGVYHDTMRSRIKLAVVCVVLSRFSARNVIIFECTILVRMQLDEGPTSSVAIIGGIPCTKKNSHYQQATQRWPGKYIHYQLYMQYTQKTFAHSEQFQAAVLRCL